MQLDKHIEYFTKALNSKKLTALLVDDDKIRIKVDNTFFFIHEKYVSVLVNTEGGIQDSTIPVQKDSIETISALALVNKLRGYDHVKFDFTESEEDYFQKSTVSEFVYPPEMSVLIQKIVDRWLAEHEDSK